MAEIPLPLLDDVTEEERLAQMRERIPIYTPEWTDHSPSEPGQAILQLMVWLAGQLQYRLNQVPEQSYRAFLRLIGITLGDGQPATVDVVFSLSAPQSFDVVIPAGTQISTRQTETDPAISFVTDAPLTIPAGATSGTIGATCTQVGVKGNVGANTLTILRSSIPYVRAVTNPSAASGGVDPESIESAKARGPQAIKNQDRAVSGDDHSTLAKAASQSVGRSWTLPLFDPSVPDQETEGHTTVVIVPVGGGDPSTELLDAVKGYLEARRLTASRLHVMGAERVPIDVTVSATRVASATDQEAAAAITAAIEAFLDDESWPAGRAVYPSELIQTIEGVAQVDHVDALSAPQSAIPIAKWQVATAGTITVTINPPS